MCMCIWTQTTDILHFGQNQIIPLSQMHNHSKWLAGWLVKWPERK